MAVTIEDKLYTTKFKSDDKSHVQIRDKAKCASCSQPCITACPGQCYSRQDDGTLLVGFEGCLECGTCRVICVQRNIEWRYPTGGFGVIYRYG